MTNDSSLTVADKLRLAAEAGITFPHLSNTDNPIDFPKNSNILDLKDAVVQLHDIARAVEKQIGIGQLSDDIRKNAGVLNTLITRFKNA